jgi:hypothetical protein
VHDFHCSKSVAAVMLKLGVEVFLAMLFAFVGICEAQSQRDPTGIAAMQAYYNSTRLGCVSGESGILITLSSTMNMVGISQANAGMTRANAFAEKLQSRWVRCVHPHHPCF